MPVKSEVSPSSLAVILEKMSEKGYSFNFDVTLELATPSLKLGTVRVHGQMETLAGKKKI
jgi:hypothetical protein